MSRFIAVEGDDEIGRIHDEETGQYAEIEFQGPNAFEHACECARVWNEMIEERDQAMEEWFQL